MSETNKSPAAHGSGAFAWCAEHVRCRFFLPVTTITYAWLVNSHRHLDGVNLRILVIAVIVDAGGLGGGEWHRRRR